MSCAIIRYQNLDRLPSVCQRDPWGIQTSPEPSHARRASPTGPTNLWRPWPMHGRSDKSYDCPACKAVKLWQRSFYVYTLNWNLIIKMILDIRNNVRQTKIWRAANMWHSKTERFEWRLPLIDAFFTVRMAARKYDLSLAVHTDYTFIFTYIDPCLIHPTNKKYHLNVEVHT